MAAYCPAKRKEEKGTDLFSGNKSAPFFYTVIFGGKTRADFLIL
jgi:hypothetical protein